MTSATCGHPMASSASMKRLTYSPSLSNKFLGCRDLPIQAAWQHDIPIVYHEHVAFEPQSPWLHLKISPPFFPGIGWSSHHRLKKKQSWQGYGYSKKIYVEFMMIYLDLLGPWWRYDGDHCSSLDSLDHWWNPWCSTLWALRALDDFSTRDQVRR